MGARAHTYIFPRRRRPLSTRRGVKRRLFFLWNLIGSTWCTATLAFIAAPGHGGEMSSRECCSYTRTKRSACMARSNHKGECICTCMWFNFSVRAHRFCSLHLLSAGYQMDIGVHRSITFGGCCGRHRFIEMFFNITTLTFSIGTMLMNFRRLKFAWLKCEQIARTAQAQVQNTSSTRVDQIGIQTKVRPPTNAINADFISSEMARGKRLCISSLVLASGFRRTSFMVVHGPQYG